MSTVLLLQTAPWRENADDAALRVAARELAPAQLLAATADPGRTARTTGLDTVPATSAALLRAMGGVDTLVVLGGRPLDDPDGHPGPRALGAVLTAYRTAGHRVALVDIGVGQVSGRRAAAVRHAVTGSALTVLDSTVSADRLVAAGLPSPLRVGAHLAWHDLQDHPRPSQDGPVAVVVDDDTLLSGGGPVSLADRLVATWAAGGEGHDTAPGRDEVLVQARRPGAAAGRDLDAAQALAACLRRVDVAARVLPPAAGLDEQRALLGAARCVHAADAETLLVAAASGTPVHAWPGDERARALHEALGRGGAAVRERVAAAGEVLDLVRLLLTEGRDAAPSRLGATAPSALRPTGVTR